MPLGIVLHEGHALALDGMGHDEGGRSLGRLRLIEGLVDLGQVVAVDVDDGPAEGLELVHHGLEVEDLLHEVVELYAVPVEDDAEIVEVMIGRPELGPGHEALPHLALLYFAVAEHAVDAGALAAELEAEGHAAGHGQALAERAGGRLDAGQRHAIGMPLEGTAQLAQGEEQALREVARLGHAEVLGGHAVALREHDAVAVFPGRALRIVGHAVEVEDGENVDHGQ